MDNKMNIELTFKKKELKAILRLLVKIAECELEGINRGALELTIQEVEGILDRMKANGRSIATVALEVTKSDFEMIRNAFERMTPEDDSDDPVDIKDIHEILGDGDGDEKSPEPAPKESELHKAPVYKPEPIKVPIKKEPKLAEPAKDKTWSDLVGVGSIEDSIFDVFR